jgi:aminoglycoside phosphotransferase (APT) family kinase protein
MASLPLIAILTIANEVAPSLHNRKSTVPFNRFHVGFLSSACARALGFSLRILHDTPNYTLEKIGQEKKKRRRRLPNF